MTCPKTNSSNTPIQWYVDYIIIIIIFVFSIKGMLGIKFYLFLYIYIYIPMFDLAFNIILLFAKQIVYNYRCFYVPCTRNIWLIQYINIQSKYYNFGYVYFYSCKCSTPTRMGNCSFPRWPSECLCTTYIISIYTNNKQKNPVINTYIYRY